MKSRNEIVLIEQATAKPYRREELRSVLEVMVKRAAISEGVVMFRMHEDRRVPGHFVLYERFVDHHALDSHRGSSNFQGMLLAAEPLIKEGVPRIIYLC